MPATATHTFFALDIYDLLDEDSKEKVGNNPEKLKMFAQSMDPIMFFNVANLRRGKDVRRFHRYFHENKTGEYLKSLVEYIKEYNLVDNPEVMSFLYGAISHYELDSTVHPYVIYKTGWLDKDNPDTYKYNGVHNFMEAFLDNDMIRRRTNSNPYTFSVSDFTFDIEPFTEGLANMLDDVFKKVYDVNYMSEYYYVCLKQMEKCLQRFRRDPNGIKRNFYKFIDSFTSKKAFRFEPVSYYYPLDDRHNFLNSNHDVWYNPTDPSIKSNKSFVELYLEALDESDKMIKDVNRYLAGKRVNLDKVFGNKSYTTGLDCDIPKDFKAFQF